MEPNENMEEFFRSSMDKFSDEPSGKVWQDLNDRLESEEPKRPLLKWIKYLTPFAVLLFAFSDLCFYQINVLKEYESQLIEMKGENIKLRSELSDQKNLSSNSQEVIAPQPATPTIIERIKEKVIYLRDTVYLTKFRDSKMSQDINYSNIDAANPGNESFLSDLLDARSQNKNNIISGQNRELIDEPYSLVIGRNIGSEYIKYPERELLFETMKFSKIKSNSTKRKKVKPAKSSITVKSLDPWGIPGFYYRVGPSVMLQATLKGNILSGNTLGVGYGVMQEFGLSSRFSVRLGVNRAFQEYFIDNNGVPFTNSGISDYPNHENLESQILSIEVNNHYLEFPLGFKYDFYQDNIKSLFMNPMVKWSVHDPQNFSYVLTDNRFDSFTSSRRFGYLNALSIAVGVEKNINSFIAYQLSIAYDQGLEPVGIEKQKLNSVNVKFNLLFGRK